MMNLLILFRITDKTLNVGFCHPKSDRVPQPFNSRICGRMGGFEVVIFVEDMMYTTRQSPTRTRPLIFVALQFLAPCGPWGLAQRSTLRTTRDSTLSGNASSSFRAAGFTATA
jgi:hypothetical protein